MERIIECVPNFSEGRNKEVINKIVNAIEKSGGVKVLDVDPGEATNRTVVTFIGAPEAVVEAAYNGVRCAGELIDMRQHHGAHPRSGATDVLPLIPVAGVSLEECAEMARGLACRIYDGLGIPCYCYEAAAFKPERKNLAVCRAGEYEALPEKIADPEKAPDFGPDREGNPITGKIIKDENGKTVMIPGTLKGCKAIGWYIDEYGIAQVSMNITDINATPLHKAFEEVCRAAAARGIRVTGTEIVGLVPKKALTDAGKYFLEKQSRSTGISEEEIIKIAVKSMGLDDLKPFNPKEKVIEYLMETEEEAAVRERLVRMSCKGFAYETASESAAPGGGSISAYMGALGAALGTMVANLSAHKPGWDSRWKEFSDYAEQGQAILKELLALVDEDTAAFNRIMAAFGMPKATEEEKLARDKAIQDATLYATEVPLKTMRAASRAFPLLSAMAQKGNPNSVSDAGVGALAARSAVLGALLNVRINAAGLKDRAAAEVLLDEADAIAAEAVQAEKDILLEVEKKIASE